MLIQTLALSSILFFPPPGVERTGQESKSSEQQTTKKSQEARAMLGDLREKILRNETETKLDRDFPRAMDDYKSSLEDLIGIEATEDLQPELDAVLHQWAVSVILSRAEMGDLSDQQLHDLGEGVPAEFARGNETFAKQWRRVFPRVVEDDRVKAVVPRPLAHRTADEDADPVRRAVEEFLANGDHDALVQLGRRAVPALTETVARDLDYLCANRAEDALVTLARIDDAAAADFVNKHMNQGGTLWRSRVLRLFQPENPYVAFRPANAWLRSTGERDKLLRTYWLEILEELTRFDEVRKDTVDALNFGPLLSSLTPKLQNFLAEALSAKDPGVRAAAMQSLSYGDPDLPLVEVIQRAATSPIPATRAWVASRLGFLKPSSQLISLADDSAEEVRFAVLGSLGNSRLWDPRTRNKSSRDTEDRPKQEHDLLRRFLADSSPRIRQSAVGIARVVDNFHVPDETILALLRDKDAGVRASAVYWVDQLSAEARAPELMRFASGEDPKVLEAMDEYVHAKPATLSPMDLLTLTEARIASDDTFLEKRWTDGRIFDRLAEAERGIERIGQWAAGNTSICKDLIGKGWVHQLSEDTYKELIRKSFGRRGSFNDLIKAASRGQAYKYDAIWNSIAAEEETPIILALRALGHAARSRPEESVSLFRGLLGKIVNEVSMDWLPGYLDDLPAKARNPMIWMLIEHPGYSPREKDMFAREYESSISKADEIQNWILDAYVAGERNVDWRAVDRAIDHMVHAPESARREVLMQAMKSDVLCESARDVIVALRNPEDLGLLRAVLRQPAPVVAHSAAIDAVQSYMSDEAAEVLIEAAGFLGDAALRKHALARVEGIREYQDAAARWAARKTSKLDRESVLGELLALLDDDSTEIRVEAIRGLGTFEAVEQLPRLIRLLQDDEQAIRDAAREAIERIHAGSKTEAK